MYVERELKGSAILASFLLDEKLGRLGVCGCACCIVRSSPTISYDYDSGRHCNSTLTWQIGSLIIVLHAPSDKDVETVDEILEYAAQPLFMAYLLFVTVFSLYMVYKVVPTHGTRNPMVYLSVCSLVGSVSVMAIKVRDLAVAGVALPGETGETMIEGDADGRASVSLSSLLLRAIIN